MQILTEKQINELNKEQQTVHVCIYIYIYDLFW
jgi:hypothetical protein